ncbi:hypothetical protein [Flexivirga endophytica]|uniref:hypothetical protein n=1 Tax=Flexivirga endophytica TaxID=1849103 RepID=UPI00166CC691|nr:hypothetical protein [Flexivirga endophytica]
MRRRGTVPGARPPRRTVSSRRTLIPPVITPVVPPITAAALRAITPATLRTIAGPRGTPVTVRTAAPATVPTVSFTRPTAVARSVAATRTGAGTAIVPSRPDVAATLVTWSAVATRRAPAVVPALSTTVGIAPSGGRSTVVPSWSLPIRGTFRTTTAPTHVGPPGLLVLTVLVGTPSVLTGLVGALGTVAEIAGTPAARRAVACCT